MIVIWIAIALIAAADGATSLSAEPAATTVASVPPPAPSSPTDAAKETRP